MPGLSVESEPRPAFGDAMARLVELPDRAPVVAARTTIVDAVTETGRVIRDGRASDPKEIGNGDSAVAHVQQAPDALSRRFRPGGWPGTSITSSIRLLASQPLLISAQDVGVIAHRRARDSKPMRYLVQGELSGEHRCHFAADVRHEHMFPCAWDANAILPAAPLSSRCRRARPMPGIYAPGLRLCWQSHILRGHLAAGCGVLAPVTEVRILPPQLLPAPGSSALHPQAAACASQSRYSS